MGKELIIMLNVNKFLIGKPLYERIIMRDDNVQKKCIFTNPTSVYREFNCLFGVKINGRLNGKRFYGLDSEDFKFCLSLSESEDSRK